MLEMNNGLEVRSPKVRAIAYYRHSVQSQSVSSLTFQRDQVHKWAGEHDVQIIHEFYDAGCSMGDSDERPAFTEMMEAWISVRTDFQYVLCVEASRWGRFPDSELSARPIELFLKYNKQVIYTLDLSSQNGFPTARLAI
jgi:DNA invertase Pin-like site-specific DNA recombinase